MEDVEKRETAGAGVCTGANRLGLIVAGMGAGAILMYLLDPDRGRGRRAKLSDQFTSKVNRLGRVAESKARDWRNRAEGMAHEIGLLGQKRGADYPEKTDDAEPFSEKAAGYQDEQRLY